MAVTLCYFTEFGKPALHETNWPNLCKSLMYFLLRVQCRRKESSRSLSHLLMSFLFIYLFARTWYSIQQLLANVNSRSRSLYVRPSVCLSVVCNVRAPYSGDWNFQHCFMPCGTLAIRELSVKILRRSSQGNPFVVGLNPRGVAKYSDFRPFEGYILLIYR